MVCQGKEILKEKKAKLQQPCLKNNMGVRSLRETSPSKYT